MLMHLLISFLFVASCAMIHGLGMLIGMKQFTKLWCLVKYSRYLPRMFWILIRVVFGLLVLHLLQFTVWAAFFDMGHYFPNLETAFYHSVTSYSTVGYGDVIPPEIWRVFGAIEAVTGVLMFGWSTDVLFAVVHRVRTNLIHLPDSAHTPVAELIP